MRLSDRLTGRRVVLRRLAVSDADSITEHIKDKAIIKWLLVVPYPYRRKDAVRFINSRRNERRTGKSFTFGISLKTSEEVIGVIDLSDIDWEDKKAEIGYWIGKRFWGRGLITEAINLMARFGFRELKLNKIYARVFEGNLASMKALEKNRFRHEGILRDEIFKYRRWIDEYYYGLLKSEYKKSR
jgi:RimJ/RimL family protein N-acetyltransferase